MRHHISIYAVIIYLWVCTVVYIDLETTTQVYGCSEDNLPTNIKKICDAKLFRTNYKSKKSTETNVRGTQQQQSPEDARDDSGTI